MNMCEQDDSFSYVTLYDIRASTCVAGSNRQRNKDHQQLSLRFAVFAWQPLVNLGHKYRWQIISAIHTELLLQLTTSWLCGFYL